MIYVGDEYGLLTIMERIRTPNGMVYDCLCKCGNTKRVWHEDLENRDPKRATRSCGCYHTPIWKRRSWPKPAPEPADIAANKFLYGG